MKNLSKILEEKDDAYASLRVNKTFGFNMVLGGNLRASDAFKSSIRSSTTPQTILVAWEHEY